MYTYLVCSEMIREESAELPKIIIKMSTCIFILVTCVDFFTVPADIHFCNYYKGLSF